MVAWLLDDKRFREPIAALGLLVTAWAVARALDDVAVVVVWSALVVGGFALWRGLRTIATSPRRVLSRRFGIELTADGLLPGAAVLVYGVAVLHVLAFELPIFDIGGSLPAVPFTDAGTIGAVSLAAAALLAGAIVGGRAAWRAPILVAGMILPTSCPSRSLRGPSSCCGPGWASCRSPSRVESRSVPTSSWPPPSSSRWRRRRWPSTRSPRRRVSARAPSRSMAPWPCRHSSHWRH